MNHRDFVYVGEPIPPIDSAKNADFVLSMQKAMLLSLLKRKLLTSSQMEQIMEIVQRKNALLK